MPHNNVRRILGRDMELNILILIIILTFMQFTSVMPSNIQKIIKEEIAFNKLDFL